LEFTATSHDRCDDTPTCEAITMNQGPNEPLAPRSRGRWRPRRGGLASFLTNSMLPCGAFVRGVRILRIMTNVHSRGSEESLAANGVLVWRCSFVKSADVQFIVARPSRPCEFRLTALGGGTPALRVATFSRGSARVMWVIAKAGLTVTLSGSIHSQTTTEVGKG
jgi:hypothetical protein